MELEIVPLEERPELEAGMWSPELSLVWPTFLRRAGGGEPLYGEGRFGRYRRHALVAFDPAEPNLVLGRVTSLPFRLGADVGREGLPDAGWDGIMRWADEDWALGRETNVVSATEILLHPRVAGRGVAGAALRALAEHSRRLGYHDLYAPVRPTLKHLEPATPMPEYARRTRDDGLPYDPWLRVHVRAGGRIVRVAPCSMTVVGTLPQWRSWTGLPFDTGGLVTVPQALVPVHVSLEHDHAVYVEPNVWVHHRLDARERREEHG